MRQSCGQSVEDRWLHGRVDETWKDMAACVGTEAALWFPAGERQRYYDPAVKALTERARLICRECPVRTQCLEYAILTDARYGMYGGLTEAERARITGRRPY